VGIRCRSKKGLTSVSVATDNIVFVGSAVALALSNLLQSLLVESLSIFSVALLSWGFKRFRLLTWRAQRLRPSPTSDLMLRMIADEAMVVGSPTFVSPLGRVYLVANARQATACVLGGLFGAKLVLTGRLLIAAISDPASTSIVIRHELGHARNGDHRVWLLLVGSLITPILLPLYTLATADSAPHFSFAPRAIDDSEVHAMLYLCNSIVASLFSAFILITLLRRRELLADAVAVNCTANPSPYIQMLSGGGSERSLWFHPSRYDRISALTHDSPVLRFSPSIVVCGMSFAFGALLSTYVAYGDNLESLGRDSQYALAAVVCGTLAAGCYALALFVWEMRKGFRRKVPVSKHEDVIAHPKGVPVVSELAVIAGMSEQKVRWGRMVIFVLGIAIAFSTSSILPWVLGNVRSDVALVAATETMKSLCFYSVMWTLVLVILRYYRSLSEAAILAVVPCVLIAFVDSHSIESMLIGPVECATLLICVGIAVRNSQNLWLSLFSGSLVGFLILHLLLFGVRVSLYSYLNEDYVLDYIAGPMYEEIEHFRHFDWGSLTEAVSWTPWFQLLQSIVFASFVTLGSKTWSRGK
jgi:Zn-dependent protease with chaperone function